MSCVTLSIHFYTSITFLEKLNKANLTCVVAGHVKTIWYMEHVIHNLACNIQQISVLKIILNMRQ